VRLPKAKIDDLEKKFIAKSALKGGDLNPKKLHLNKNFYNMLFALLLLSIYFSNILNSEFLLIFCQRSWDITFNCEKH